MLAGPDPAGAASGVWQPQCMVWVLSTAGNCFCKSELKNFFTFSGFLNDCNVRCSLKATKAVETSCAPGVGGLMAEARI